MGTEVKVICVYHVYFYLLLYHQDRSDGQLESDCHRLGAIGKKVDSCQVKSVQVGSYVKTGEIAKWPLNIFLIRSPLFNLNSHDKL